MLDKRTIEEISRENNEPKDILKSRLASYGDFLKLEMPSVKKDAWRYAPVKEIDLARFKEYGEEKTEIVVKKGKGVIAVPVKEAFKKNKELVMKYFPASQTFAEDKFSAMHSALWNSGFLIYVPKNIEAEVRVNSVCSKEGIIAPNNFIIADENSKLCYFEETYSEAGKEILKIGQTRVSAKENSEVLFNSFQDTNEKVISLYDWKASLSKDSRIKWVFGMFGGKVSRVKIDTQLNGEGCDSKTYGVFFGQKKEFFDVTTNTFHNTPNTKGNINVKGAHGGSSGSVYRGKIKIMKEAQRTNSFLEDHSLMLSDKAISNSIPSLEIDANDVKASHNATIGTPDEEDLFYLMARGLSRKEAERLIITGFFSPVLDEIKDSMFKEKIEKTIEAKKDA